MKRILVTGAAGFVGRHALAALSAAVGPNDQIIGIGRHNIGPMLNGAIFRQIDLLDAIALSNFFCEYRPTDVLHLAAIASVQQSVNAPIDTWRVNLQGLLNLAESAAQYAAGSNFFFVSSGEVYGYSFLASHPLSEDVEPKPLGAYARSKWFGELILRDVLPRAEIKLVILRPFNHIGPGQDERFVVPSFSSQIARIEAGCVPPILEVGNLMAKRDFLPIGDVVRAYVALIANAQSIKTGTVYNIASGHPRSIADILTDLRRQSMVPFDIRIVDERMRPAEIAVAAGDSGRIMAAIDWAPTEDWDTAISDILAEARAKVRSELHI
ncbi:NAD-dependent epimerase/dehydratase family protein [Methylobacterium sp. WL30]|uniref:NAD-dependent epimerase/dehydratase family protein n=1 Tax=unclassified Methylobacterium TaxID=2615210 RepID=UPI0011C8A024|nr:MULTISPECIES: NAD-dependent epimerase/dehydratase family protein [unclassified Methylobacterium]TXN40719.1 NAD-dependent epimerase/dehydratase family protein [Methylobacterium sp. WL93]TXN49081.1 NAD-dependent epimerase/dehydratase family protein [Methylobacterium sp. WL119]TXN62796.1 NAD-dependent epimerase/dehydratase family protein [Methylobacterium sp. WL30]